MSTSKTSKAAAVNSQDETAEEESNGVFQMPDDYQLVTPMEGEQRWWKPEVGAVVFGRLLGRFPRRDGDGAYYQIRVEKFGKGKLPPVRAITGKGDDAKTIEVGIGEVINMDERSSIANLAPQAMSDGVYNVLINCLEKVKISGGRTYWRMTAGIKQVKAPSSPIVPMAAKRTDDMGASY